MMGIESWMFSTQWAPKLSISDLAWLDSWPNTIYSLMDLREYNLSFHTYWFFELLSFSSLYSFTASSKWVASCFHFFGPLLWCVSNLLALLPCFPTSPSGSRDEVRLTSVCGMRCSCCCWLCQFPFNVTLGVGRRPFEKYCSLLVLWRTSWLQKKWIRLQELQSLILRFFQSYPICNIGVALSKTWNFSRNCVIGLTLHLFRILSKWFIGVRRTAWRPVSSSLPPGINPLFKIDWRTHWFPQW